MRADDFRQTLQRAPGRPRRPAPRGRPTRSRRSSSARELHLSVELADDLGTFEIDADKIAAAVVNLLTNAIKFTPDGGEIGLSAPRSSADDEAEIAVADCGIGLEPRALEPALPAVLHPVRSEPPLLGRLRVQQAWARPRSEHRQAVRRAARRPGLGRERRRARGPRVTIRLPRRPFPQMSSSRIGRAGGRRAEGSG